MTNYTENDIKKAIDFFETKVKVYKGYFCRKHDKEKHDCNDCDEFFRKSVNLTHEEAVNEVNFRIENNIPLTRYNDTASNYCNKCKSYCYGDC